MAYREENRYQQTMFPPSLDELIDEKDAKISTWTLNDRRGQVEIYGV